MTGGNRRSKSGSRVSVSTSGDLLPERFAQCIDTDVECSSCFPQVVRRQRGKAVVFDWATNREMVEALPITRRDAEHLVNRIIEVAADPGRTNARLFRLKVQHLAHETGLPEKISVEAGAIGNKAVHVVGYHPEAEGPV